jgi:oxygen-dependent protoporphyrinogen oxidase
LIADVIVIGGGITGLSAARRLQALGIDYALLERDSRWGGKLLTLRPSLESHQPCIMEAGAESFITRKPELLQLTHEVGLGDDITALDGQSKGLYILHHGQPYPVPLNPLALIRSRLLSPRGKLRLLAEPFIPARQDTDDESLADFARRRLGQEAAERLVGPILGGIYNADPERQSVLVSAPHMRALERQYGSLARGALAHARRKQPPETRPAFITLKSGVDRLVTALVEQLSGALCLHTPIQDIRGGESGYELTIMDGTRWGARAVILAIPASQTAHLLQAALPAAAKLLAQFKQSSIGTMLMAFRTADLPVHQAITSMVVPRWEQRAVDALVWTSARIPLRVPEGFALLKVFFGGSQPQLMALSDEQVMTIIRAELYELLHIEAVPVLHHIFRWREDYPLMEVGHLVRVAQVRSQLPPGLFIAGSSYEGVGVPDCIRQGTEAAESVAKYLGFSIS